MQPEPFNSNAQAQPFASSTAQPLQNSLSPAPIPTPTAPVDLEKAPVDIASTEGAPTEDDAFASLVKAHSSGANWFFWIVALSLVNAVLVSFDSDRVLAIGTNATLVVDYIIKDEIALSPSTAGMLRGIEFVLDAIILGFYTFCGLMAVRGKTWGFYLGMTVFALDALISVISVDVIGGLIHLWALFSMWQGAKALKQIHAIKRAAQVPASPWAA